MGKTGAKGPGIGAKMDAGDGAGGGRKIKEVPKVDLSDDVEKSMILRGLSGAWMSEEKSKNERKKEGRKER